MSIIYIGNKVLTPGSTLIPSDVINKPLKITFPTKSNNIKLYDDKRTYFDYKNISEFVPQVIPLSPGKITLEINGEKTVFNYINRVPSAGSSVSSVSDSKKKNTGKKNRTQKEKWCDCVLKVATKQEGKCIRDKAWFKTINGKQCYNVYAVCSKSVGTSSRHCDYDFPNLSLKELKAYAQLKGIPEADTKDELLRNITDWKTAKGKI